MNHGGGVRIDLRVLGPVELRVDYSVVPVGGRNTLAVLALLTLHRKRAVPADELVGEIWGVDVSPRKAIPRLHVLVSKLRNHLRSKSIDDTAVLASVASGYRLAVDADCDLDRFESARAAADMAGDHAAAARLYRSALAEWRGAPLSGLRGFEFADAAAGPLEEHRWACLEARVDADLARGATTELIGELTASVHEHPLRERQWEQLATAQYLSGRQAEALGSLRQARRVLGEEIGALPGAALVDLERKILHQEALGPPPRPAARPLAAAPTVDRDPQRHTGWLILADGRQIVVGASGLKVGRMPDNDLVLDDVEVSRYHARISRSAVGMVIRDLDSTNGVTVNDEHIDQVVVLSESDVIQIGSATMTFHIDLSGAGSENSENSGTTA